MAVVPGHPDAIRELRPVPRARFLPAQERREPDIFIAGIFGEAPQAGVIEGICRVHVVEWGRAGYEGDERAGRK